MAGARRSTRDAPGLPEQVKVAADAEVPAEVVQLVVKSASVRNHAGLSHLRRAGRKGRLADRVSCIGWRAGACTCAICMNRRLELRVAACCT